MRGHWNALALDPAVDAGAYELPEPTFAASPDRFEWADGEGWLATATDTSYTVTVRGDERSLVEQISTSGIQDDFGRNFSNGWGNTYASGRWLVRSGALEDYNVVSPETFVNFTTSGHIRTPGVGKMRVNTANTSARIAPASYGYDYKFANVAAEVSTDKMPSGDSQSASIMIAYQNVSNHYLGLLQFERFLSVTEDFDRTVSDGWGTAPNGSAWANTSPNADYSVSGGLAVHELSAANSSRRSSVLADDNHEVLTKVRCPVRPTGSSVWAGVMLRYTDFQNHYIARLRFGASGTNAAVSVQKVLAGTTTTITTEDSLGVQIPDNEYWWIRARIENNNIKMRAWKDGDEEPPTWQHDHTDASSPIETGSRAGVRSISVSSTNLPLDVEYGHFELIDGLDATTCRARLCLQKREAGSTTNLTSFVNVGRHAPGVWWNLRTDWNGETNVLRARAWEVGTTEPDWQASITDATFTQGDVGVRGYLSPDYDDAPVEFSWRNYSVSAEWINPPTVTHNVRVYILPVPFGSTPEWGPNGTAFKRWLRRRIVDQPYDVFDVAFEYVNNNVNEASYGPRMGDGRRQEGSDWNDFLGVTAYYPDEVDLPNGAIDVPESWQIGALDCSGFTRTIFGVRNKMPMSWWAEPGTTLPRRALMQAGSGPGVLMYDTTPDAPTEGQLNELRPGDFLAWDADTSNEEEDEGQIDHCGIYVGLDTDGNHRHLSSRKMVNGPTMSDVGGKSILGSTNLYSVSFRLARRL